MAIERDFFLLDDRIMVIDSHEFVIVRDRKDENFPIKFYLALYRFVKLNAVRTLTRSSTSDRSFNDSVSNA